MVEAATSRTGTTLAGLDGLAVSGSKDERLISRLFRDGVQFCSGLVDLVVGVGRHGGGGHRLTFAGERFVGRVAETSRRWVIAVVNSGNAAAEIGLSAKPAMVAAGS